MSTVNCMTKRVTDSQLHHAITRAENLRNLVDGLLTWGQIDGGQRAELAQAANALELAASCLRMNGPGRTVKIGF